MVKKIWMGKESLNQPSNLGFGAWGKESLYKRTPFATHLSSHGSASRRLQLNVVITQHGSTVHIFSLNVNS